MARITKATLLAGLLSGLIAPAIWPFVVLLIDGAWPTWSVYPVAALTISFFAIIVATPCCIVLGGLVLLALEQLNLNTPAISGILGLVSALLIYLLVATSYNYPSLSEFWPLAAFFVIIGSTCGALASYLSRTNESLKAGTPQSGATWLNR
jgi:hypothetical protein